MQINLYGGDVPYLGLNTHGVQCFVPFRHTLEFFTKSPDHDMWSFDDMDEEEFTPEMRKIKDWEFIIYLDRSYNHGTMICCMNQTVHGNRFSVHSKKNYRVQANIDIDISLDIGDNGIELFENVQNSVLRLQEMYPERCTNHTNVNIQPAGRISVYTMHQMKYSHSQII